MKIHLIILTAVTLSVPVLAQQTNELRPPKGDRYGEHKNGNRGERRHKDMTEEQKAEMQERRLQLMQKTLNDIGVTEEQKVQIVELQQKQREQMKATFEKVEESKCRLSELERSSASEEEIYAAIDAVSDAQAEQMKILARNRIQMERILGKEKFKLFMESARSKWKEHGRRGGSGIPPRPDNQGNPPIPQANRSIAPPTP
ncbi:hypothetical protein P4B35_03480 [Pontiellaceae bacterium B12227]|nr:hypothetical protein [Pontiellaceae bacterium B12227]